MTAKEVFMGPPPPPGFPSFDVKGYAILLQDDRKAPLIVVYTEAYASKILPLQNAVIAKNKLEQQYVVPNNAPPIKHVEWLDGVNKRLGLVDRRPQFVEIVDVLFDVKPNETDFEKGIIKYEKKYNLVAGQFLSPAYRLSQLLPTPLPPLPTSPIL